MPDDKDAAWELDPGTVLLPEEAAWEDAMLADVPAPADDDTRIKLLPSGTRLDGAEEDLRVEALDQDDAVVVLELPAREDATLPELLPRGAQ